MSMAMGRRRMLGLLAALAFPTPARSAVPSRMAAIDWAMLETAMALGVTPVAATELIQFRKDAVEPVIPGSVADLGLRGSPNFERLYLLKPDLILISPFYTRHQSRLEAIAPVFSLPFYAKGEPPFEKALKAVSALGARLGRSEQAAAVLQQQEQTLAAIKAALVPFATRPVYVINIGDARHFRAFGADSMFGDVLQRLGLANAWTDRSRYTFAAPVPLENLAAKPDAIIVIVSDIPVEARTGLENSMIWRSLMPVKENRVIRLANINPYGGIIAGMRFAGLLHEALLSSGEAI
ncbi:iron complex transport system substrate-binding protein [Phyllobacterium leguminum]|uniref:Iron complex transport system substrate-binding protein n=2 Tax=Phyllobacterium leguminum TaxID=314237 RepID=A0A318T138_9HYPH|nr:iron complex transport system substrate-binding protein [Phyllobacterium leguminum]